MVCYWHIMGVKSQLVDGAGFDFTVVIVWEVMQGYLLYFLRLVCGGSPHGLEDSGLFFYYNFTVEG